MPAEPPDRPSTDAERLWIGLAAGIALLAVLARFWMSWQTRSLGEDALITLRYAENIAAGRGFVYNPGERVLGSTTPLYTLLLALAAWLHTDAMAVGQACNILADGVTCYMLARLLARREIEQPAAGLFVALLYAFSSTPISVSISGMETGLVTCTGFAMLHAYLARRSLPLCLLGAGLFLLRIDGLLLFGFLAASLAWQEKRITWRDLGLALLTTLPWLVFAWLYFGSPIPTSFVAKITVYSHAPPARYAVLDPFRDQFLLGAFQRTVTLLAILGAVRIAAAPWLSERKEMGRLLPSLLWLLLYYGTMLASPVPAFAWYFLPPWPLFLALAGLGGSELLSLCARRVLPSALPHPQPDQVAALRQSKSSYPTEDFSETERGDKSADLSQTERRASSLSPPPSNSTEGTLESAQAEGRSKQRPYVSLSGAVETADLSRFRVLTLVLLLFCACLGVWRLRALRNHLLQQQQQEDTLRRPTGLWFRAHAGPRERILLEPIGYVGYFSHRPILDLVGLVSPEVFPSYSTPHPLTDIVTRLKPEWLCLRPLEVARVREGDAALPEREYEYIRFTGGSADNPAFVIYHRKQNSPP